MQNYLQRTKILTKDKIQNHYLLLKISCMLIVSFLAAGIFTDTAQAATGLKIYDYATKKESTYTGKQIKVTLNGTAIGKTNTPGILINGVSVVPYNDIFEKSNIAAECAYNKTKGTVSISKSGITIKMTIGSKKATVNGKAVTLTVAPIKLKYISADIVKVLVPSRFVAETLGLGYTWNSSSNTVAIVKKSLLLSYNGGKKFDYTGAQGQVTIDGKKVNLGTMPSIITNNTAMLRVNKVFASSSIGAKYSYDSSKKTVTLSKGDNTLVMTVGSTAAYLNGNRMVMDSAPIVVKNYNDGNSYVMVPGGFTASCLGYEYSWSNSTRTSIITTRTKDTTSSSGTKTNNSDPELGDSGVITETGTILNQWNSNDTLYAKCTDVHQISDSATGFGNGIIYSLSRSYDNQKSNCETFAIQGTVPFGKVTASNSGKTITVKTTNMTCTDQTYQMYGSASNYVNTIATINNEDGKSSAIELEVLPEHYSYDISLSGDKLTLYVTVYINSVASVTVGTNTAGDYITFNGIMPFNASINQSTGCLNINLPYTTNALGDIYSEIYSSRYMKQFNITSGSNGTQIILMMYDGYEYYTANNGNQLTVLLQTPGQSQQTTTPTPTPTPTPSGNTGVIDTSTCEIVIPKPEGITASSLTDEDYYFNHYFVIKIPGNFVDFFYNNAITYSSGVISDVSVSLNSYNETEIKISTTKLQGYEFTADDKNIYVNIGNPKEIYKNIVVLDPGHGGEATGAKYFGTMEKDMNFTILYTVGKKYFNQNTSRLKVYYTRISDVDMTLSNRAAFASQYGADLFVSLHMNASTSSNAYGTEVYYSNSNNEANNAGLTSQTMANIFVNNISSAIGTSNRGPKTAAYTVVHANTVPAVLIELGFLSNSSDYAKITDSVYQEKTAKTIYETLLQVFDTYPTGR